MKILVFADLHYPFDIPPSPQRMRQLVKRADKIVKKAEKEKVDMIICAGDVSEFGQYTKEVVKKLASSKMSVLIIPGNHENPRHLKEICAEYPNMVYLEKGMLRLKDYVFMGFSANGFSEKDSEFVKWAAKVKREFRKNDKIVLITHAPPYGTKLDSIMGSHCGNKDIRKFIETTNIVLGVSGHIHETAGKEDVIKGRKVINPGPKGKVLEI